MKGRRQRLGRRFAVLAVAGAAAMLVGLAAAPASTARADGPSLAGVEAALRASPVYIDPSAGEPTVDARRLLKVLPHGTYFAALPTAYVAAAGDPAGLPGVLSSKLGSDGTFVVLVGGRLYGSSTTIPAQLGDELGSAQSALPATGDATPALVALMRSLSGSGDLSDVAGPSRAGGPVGGPLLIVMAVILVAGGLALWWWIRRPPRRRRPRPPAPLRDLVEIDASGRITKRTPAAERQRP